MSKLTDKERMVVEAAMRFHKACIIGGVASLTYTGAQYYKQRFTLLGIACAALAAARKVKVARKGKRRG